MAEPLDLDAIERDFRESEYARPTPRAHWLWNDIPALLAEVRRLRAELEQAQRDHLAAERETRRLTQACESIDSRRMRLQETNTVLWVVAEAALLCRDYKHVWSYRAEKGSATRRLSNGGCGPDNCTRCLGEARLRAALANLPQRE